ncbi:MAG: hypothetical protein AB7U85_07130 [Alphaproteobacteria bacterium]
MFRIICVFSLLMVIQGCTSSFAPVASNRSISGTEEEAIPASFAQFPDLPFPEKTIMDLDSTVVLGSGESWTGKIVFSAPYNVSSMFDFYMSEMPKFNWQEVAIIRSKISSMTYVRRARVVTIQLENSGTNDTTISLVVTPRNQDSNNVK